ncbi:MAG: tetratricopeptide repeat protein [Bradymonadales bacterium]|nr:tetratricopeptide repeat protein [Bradymonadales bacterium]
MKRCATLGIVCTLAAALPMCEQSKEQPPPPSLAGLGPLGEEAQAGQPPAVGGASAGSQAESAEQLWDDFSLLPAQPDRRDISAGLQMVRDARRAWLSGDIDHAIRMLQDALRWDPSIRSAWELLLEIQQEGGDLEGAAQTCIHLISSVTLHAFERAQLQQQCALLNRSAGRMEQAEELARQSVASSSGRLESLTTLTGILLERGNYREVIALLEGNIRFPGSDLEASAFNNLGAAYAAQGQLEQAEATYRRGLEINPRRTDILLNLSDVHRMNGQTGEMRETLQRILEIDPTHEEAARRLGR